MITRWQELRSELDASGVRLIAVSKYVEDAPVQWLIDAGQQDFGESRPQALRDRSQQWPHCQWHMIGPLQKNKAKYVGRYAAMWHSVEDAETARLVAGHVEGRRLPVLLQVNIARAPQQHGVAAEDAGRLLEAVAGIDGLVVLGLMGIAPAGGNVRSAFGDLRRLRDDLFGGSLAELCMGMSDDYPIAVEEGATMVRLGSTLFDAADSRNKG